MTINPERGSELTMKVRIPGWARNEPVPSSLYSFVDKNDEQVGLMVNGKSIPSKIEKGYASAKRKWKRGDVIELNLPMPVRRIQANDLVVADRGRVALQRGPIVYAAEWPDNVDGHVRNLVVPNDSTLTAEFKPDVLNGVVVIKGNAASLSYNQQGTVDRREQTFTAIPYYAWANRGPGEMIVWIPNDIGSARPQPFPTVASTSKVTTSGGQGSRSINDQNEPQFSADPSNSFFHWWPKKGTTEWVEYAFNKTTSVSEVELYWFDDTGTGECRVPKNWRLLYKEGQTWKPVETSDTFGVEKDRYNKVTFKPITTDGLRIEVTLQPEWSAGIQEWKVQ
jgi:hypothetical protein